MVSQVLVQSFEKFSNLGFKHCRIYLGKSCPDLPPARDGPGEEVQGKEEVMED